MMNMVSLFFGILVILGGALSDHVPLSSLFNLTAFIIVICGSASAGILQFGFGPPVAALRGVIWLMKPPRVDLADYITRVAEWSSLARGQGTLALERVLDEVEDPFQRQGLQLIVDNTPPEDLALMLGIISETTSREQEHPAEFWEAVGGYSPTIGVLGAVMGLIHVMMRLDHPEELGEGIATAFIATVYGVGFANLVALPLGMRLKSIARAAERDRQVVIQGLLLLAEGKPRIVIRQTLQIYLEGEEEEAQPQKAPSSQGEPAAATQAA